MAAVKQVDIFIIVRANQLYNNIDKQHDESINLMLEYALSNQQTATSMITKAKTVGLGVTKYVHFSRCLMQAETVSR